jgi:hypothetical protein
MKQGVTAEELQIAITSHQQQNYIQEIETLATKPEGCRIIICIPHYFVI